jgi:hypothetical protein
MTYNPDEEIEQDRLSKIVGGLIIPEIIIKRFVESNTEDDIFFSKKGQASLIFGQLKNDLFEGINNYPFRNLGTFIDRQRQRVDDQAEILHNSVCNLLPGQFAIEARAKARHQPTNEEKLKIITLNIYFSLRSNCDHLLNNILIQHLNAPAKTNNTPNNPIETLEDASLNKDSLSQMLEILKAADLIDKDTNIFKDKRSGRKGGFYSTMIIFYEKGYLKRRPTSNEYRNICSNTFKVEISSDTARNHKTRGNGLESVPQFNSKD